MIFTLEDVAYSSEIPTQISNAKLLLYFYYYSYIILNTKSIVRVSWLKM